MPNSSIVFQAINKKKYIYIQFIIELIKQKNENARSPESRLSWASGAQLSKPNYYI